MLQDMPLGDDTSVGLVPEVTLTARSYCTGYTGLEIAVRAALDDFEVLSHSDIKPAAGVLLDHYYPEIPNIGDMRQIDYSTLEPADLMIGSWPCQPHSAAGKRLGEADPRDLWPEFERAIDAHRPAIFFGENVARIATNGELRRVVSSLARRGYVGAWRSVRASDVGACHRRDRMFLVAIDPGRADLLDGRSGGDVDVVRGLRGDGLTLLPTPTVRDVHGAGGQDGKQGSLNLRSAVALLPTPKATDGTKGGPGMRGSSGDLMLPSAVMQLLPTPCARDWREGSEFVARPEKIKLTHTIKALDDAGERWGPYAQAVAHHEQVSGHPAPEPTQVSAKTGKGQLSARFVEWMMMLPEGWVTDVPNLVDSPRKSERNVMLSLLGDGVVPAQGAVAFRFLLDHLAVRLEVAA